MSKIITVFGATGAQGGAVVKAILADTTLSKDFKIRGVTRDTSKPNAQNLAKQGVELVTADLNSKDSVVNAIKGSYAIFLVTNYWESASSEVEQRQGTNVIEAAQETGVQQFIFSSLLPVAQITNNRLSHVVHFDGKAELEKKIRGAGFPFVSFVLPGYYMSNLQSMLRKKEGEDGYDLYYPVKAEAEFPLFDTVTDMGLFTKPALKDPQAFNGKQVLAATDYYSVTRIVSEFEEATGKKIDFHHITSEQYKKSLPDFMAEEMLENHLFIEQPGYYNGASLKESLDALDGKPTAWKDFAARHFA